MAARSPESATLRSLLRRAWYVFFRQRPYYYAGALFWAAMNPGARARFRAERFRRSGPPDWRDNCLRVYLDACYYSRFGSSPALPPENRERWSGPTGLEYHQAMLQYYTERPEEFETQHTSLLAQLQKLFAGQEYEYVVEVGCGNGLLLERVGKLAPASATLVGLDMNPDIIALNRHRPAHSRAQYHESATVQEFLQRAAPRSALVYGSGTFAFFTPNELLHCLEWLQRNVPRGAVVIADSTFLDPAGQPASQPTDGYGFRHNYENLLRSAGLKSVCSQLEPFPDFGVSRIVASGVWDGTAPGRS